jgi:hypothetical protein
MAYSIRVMRPQDIPEVERHCRLQNERDGTSYGVPEIFDESWRISPNIPVSLVIVDGDNVVQGVVVERTAELLLFGTEPRATAELHKHIEGLFYVLRQKGYSGLHCFVPKQVEIPIAKPLEKAGFVRDDFRLSHYFKNLQEPDAADIVEGSEAEDVHASPRP